MNIPKIAQTAATFVASAEPPILRQIAPEKRVELDVREELRAGREPFGIIMAAIRSVSADGVFILRATFEPVPLYTVLGRQGFSHWTEKLADDDWRVSFYHEAPPAAEVATEDDVVILDVRGLEPPEPMMRTLAALEILPRPKTLLQINSRVPRFLLPELEERGFTYQVKEQEPGLVRIFINHRKEQ